MSAMRRIVESAIAYFGASVLLSVCLLTYLPQKVIRVESFAPIADVVIDMFPQGWSFFTKSAFSYEYEVYALEADHVGGSYRDGFVSWSGALGLSREYRNSNAEIELLESRLEPGDFSTCEGTSANECFASSDTAQKSIVLESPMARPKICGEVLLFQTEAVPWEWRDLVDKRAVFVGLAQVLVECNEA